MDTNGQSWQQTHASARPGRARDDEWPNRYRWLSRLAPLLALGLLAAACTASSAREPEQPPVPDPHLGIELPLDQNVKLPFVVSGWAVNLAAPNGTGVEWVQVLDGGCEGAVIGIAEYGIARPDIQQNYGEQFLHSGWEFEVAALHYGDRILAVRSQSTGASHYDGCQAMPITVVKN